MYSETASKFEAAVRELIDHYGGELGLSCGEAIGILEIVQFDLLCGTLEDEEEDESEAWKKGKEESDE